MIDENCEKQRIRLFVFLCFVDEGRQKKLLHLMKASVERNLIFLWLERLDLKFRF